MRCVNTGRLRLGQVCSPAAVQSVCWTLKMVENSSTARPVPVRLKSRLSVLAIACVPVSEKSAPNAYMWATSRVSRSENGGEQQHRPARARQVEVPAERARYCLRARQREIRSQRVHVGDIPGELGRLQRPPQADADCPHPEQ